MTTGTTGDSTVNYNSRTDWNENDSGSVIESYVCPVRRLSDRDEEISIVQSLPQQVEPDRHASRTVDRTIARHAERVDRQVELVENQFRAINDQIGCRMAEACQALDECLRCVDGSLAHVLGDRQSHEYMGFDLLRACLVAADRLIGTRDRKIDEFAAALRDLETERTALVRDCYRRHVADAGRLSAVAYGRLYDEHLKDYNAIKLGNFRTYGRLTFALARSSASVRHEFAARAHDVVLTVARNVAQDFAETFRTAAAAITSHEVSAARTGTIDLLRGLRALFDGWTRASDGHGADVAFVADCSGSLGEHADALDAIARAVTPLRGQAIEAIRSLLGRAADGYAMTVAGSGVRLGPGELTAVNAGLSAEASAAQRHKTDDVSDVRLLLDDARRAVETVGATLGPALAIVRGHPKRLMDAWRAVSAALDTTFQRNDSKSNALGEQLDVALDALARASDETDVVQLAEICDDVTEHIRNRTELDRQREIEVVSKFRDLMASELEASRSTARKVHVNVVVSIPESDHAAQNGTWVTSVTSDMTSFKTALKTCQQTLHKQLSSFIAKVKISDFPNNEWALANLKCVIDERFNVKSKVFRFRTIALRDAIVNKRLDELRQHRSLLERHVEDAREKSDRLTHDTKQMYKIFDLKTNELILKNIELIGSHAEELSVREMTELIEKLRRKIDSVADELNSAYKSHYDKVESDYQAIEHSTLEFIKSIKMFPEGGNYGDAEAAYTVNALNALTNTMAQEQSNIIKTLAKHSYEPIIEIKKLFGRMMTPLDIELRKKVCKQTYYSINKLVNIAVGRDVSKLEKNMDFLRAKLHDVKTVLGKGEINESSRCWSEMLSETKAFMGFVLQSFRDIKSLLKSKIKSSIWNSDNEKAYTSSVISMKSTRKFPSGTLGFPDHSKSIVRPETTGGRRFLNNVFLSVCHYIAESQKNATNLASAESSANAWVGEKPNATPTYNEIMNEAMKKSKTIVLLAELIWIVTLSDFFDFLCREYHGTEREFKNAVLTTYHEESVTKMEAAFAAFTRESAEVRKRLKKVREEISYMLKPSHGHPLNAQRLENLLADFRRANSECLNTLTDTCTGMETELKKIVKNYEKECPKDVFEAITLSVKRYSNLKTKLDSINIKVVNAGYEREIMSETLATRIAGRETVELALNNVKDHLRTEPGAVFWPENKQLWTGNVQAFKKLCRDRLGDVRVFGAVEKSKSIDWATNFVRDVERVKGFYDNENNGWRAQL